MPYEDHDLWLRMAQRTHLANLPDVLLQYRLVGTSVTGRHDRTYDCLADRAAERNSAIIFAGIKPGTAIDLRLKGKGELREQMCWRDVFLLRKAAVQTALSFGKPRNYFTLTKRYQRQRQYIISNVRLGSTYLTLEEKLRCAFHKMSGTRRLSRVDLTRGTVTTL